MGHFENFSCSRVCILILFTVLLNSQVFADDRCKDDSFCRAYCLSTNPDTVSARCGRDLASCICITPYNQAVKVRFIEERNPVPPTPSTTPLPVQQSHGVQYVNAQTLQNGNYNNNLNGNGNSIAGTQQQQQAQTQQDQLTPVLLECDASESSTRMCHLFCTMEIRAWYGLCNTTSKACACFGIPLSAVQEGPIAAIFHSTAPVTTPPPTLTKPTPPQVYQQQPQQFPQQQQQWQPIPASSYPNYPYQSPPPMPPSGSQTNQLHEQGHNSPVRSVVNMFGSNGQPVSPAISTPTASSFEGIAFSNPNESEGVTSELPSEEANTEPAPVSASVVQAVPVARKRRSPSLNDTPIKKGKENPSDKDMSWKGDCTKFKCGIACKRNNYISPDCEPKCFDGECLCECTPRL